MDGSPCCSPARANHPGERPQPQSIVSVASRHDDIVWLDGGLSYCGTTCVVIKGDGEQLRETRVAPFGIDRFAVTNRRFAAFVAATGFVSEAERFGWSFVFKDALAPGMRPPASRVAEMPWWYRIEGARWDRPAGENSSIEEILDHPAVHVSRNDAEAFAA
jgi:formylglycine-generating enzyme required for sulfatase activity